MTLLIIALLMVMNDGKTVKMSTKPLKSNGVELKLISKIIDKDFGFYKSIDTSISTDGKVVVLDKGNFLVHVFDIEGKKLFQFGKEGNGPGELSSAQMVLAYPTRIIVKKHNRILLFNYEGHFIKEVSDYAMSATFIQTKKGFKYVFSPRRNPMYLSKEFDLSGNLISEVKNPNYQPYKKNDDIVEEIKSNLKTSYLQPKNLKLYKDGFVQYYNGSYKIEVLDKELKSLYTLTRPFDRLRESSRDVNFFGKKSLTKEEKKLNAQLNSVKKGLTDGYISDIRGILGSYNGYLFVEVSSSKMTLSVDVISPNNEYFTSFEIDIEGFVWATIVNNKLIVEINTDEDGRYSNIYDIRIHN